VVDHPGTGAQTHAFARTPDRPRLEPDARLGLGQPLAKNGLQPTGLRHRQLHRLAREAKQVVGQMPRGLRGRLGWVAVTKGAAGTPSLLVHIGQTRQQLTSHLGPG
ncbi:MAG: hypothetical protein ACK559_31040, partial [bacterium]